jgi:hypothetical protein
MYTWCLCSLLLGATAEGRIALANRSARGAACAADELSTIPEADEESLLVVSMGRRSGAGGFLLVGRLSVELLAVMQECVGAECARRTAQGLLAMGQWLFDACAEGSLCSVESCGQWSLDVSCVHGGACEAWRVSVGALCRVDREGRLPESQRDKALWWVTTDMVCEQIEQARMQRRVCTERTQKQQ